jgi:parallel beta-helix repeat protein
MGYSIKVRVNDTAQEAVLQAEFNALSALPYLAGVNYWVGAENDTPTRTSPHIFSGTTGVWILRPAAYDLSNFYKVEQARTVSVASDGTGDFTTIDAAVLALGKAGGKIILKEGLYAPAILASNIWLLGSGDKSIIRIPDGSRANAILATVVNNVLISNLHIDGNRAKSDNSGPTYTSVNGIRVYNSSAVSIDTISVANTYYGGITIDRSTNISITNNRVYGSRDNGIFLRPGNIDVVIRGNTVSASSYSGIQCLRSDNVSISNNDTYDNGPTQAQGDGIGSEGCRYTTIINNIIYNNGAQGVKVDYTIEGGTAPQRSFHISVINNSIYSQSGKNLAGILVTRSDFTQVSGNHIYNNFYGVNIGDVGETIISGNFGAHSVMAIRAYDAHAAGPITISSNDVQTSSSNQIELSSGNTKVIGNTIYDGAAGSIRLNAGRNYIIANNTIYSNAHNNVEIANGVANVTM